MKANSFLALLLNNEIWREGNTVYAKLLYLIKENSSTVNNFLIQCEVQFLSVLNEERCNRNGM